MSATPTAPPPPLPPGEDAGTVVSDLAVLNGMRLVLCVVAVLTAVLVVRFTAERLRQQDPGALATATLAAFALIAAADQATRLGNPVVTWRLPAYAIALTLALVGIAPNVARTLRQRK